MPEGQGLSCDILMEEITRALEGCVIDEFIWVQSMKSSIVGRILACQFMMPRIKIQLV
jgi:hypothetical protein